MKKLLVYSEHTTIECEPYKGRLTAKSCSLRHLQSQQSQPKTWNKLKSGQGDLHSCRGCPVGESVTRQLITLRAKNAAKSLSAQASETRALAEEISARATELELAAARAAEQAEGEGDAVLDDDVLDALEEFPGTIIAAKSVRRSR